MNLNYKVHVKCEVIQTSAKSDQLGEVGVRGLSFTRFLGRLGVTDGGVELGRFLYQMSVRFGSISQNILNLI